MKPTRPVTRSIALKEQELIPEGYTRIDEGDGELDRGVKSAAGFYNSTLPNNVVRIKNKSTGELASLKVVDLDHVSHSKEEGITYHDLREITLLRSIKAHPNVVSLRHVSLVGRHLCSVFAGAMVDLREYTYTKKKENLYPDGLCVYTNQRECSCIAHAVPPRQCRRIMRKVLRGLAHCHARGVVHRDLWAKNILVADEGRFVKLSNFELARSVAASQISNRPMRALTHEIVTLWYRAPEILLGAGHHHGVTYGSEVDLWSAGCMFAELVSSGRPLFPGDSEIDELYQIFRMLGTPGEAVWPGCTKLPDWNPAFPNWSPKSLRALVPNLRDPQYGADAADAGDGVELLEQLLAYNPRRRITAAQALKHSFFSRQQKAQPPPPPPPPAKSAVAGKGRAKTTPDRKRRRRRRGGSASAGGGDGEGEGERSSEASSLKMDVGDEERSSGDEGGHSSEEEEERFAIASLVRGASFANGTEDDAASSSPNRTGGCCSMWRCLRMLEDLERTHWRRDDFDFINRQQDLTARMRAVLVDWLVEVAGEPELRLQPQTLHLTIRLIDRALSALENVERSNLQCLGCVCMLLASKYEETYTVSVDEFVWYSDQTYTAKQLIDMERRVLVALDFDVASVPNPYQFLDIYLGASRACELAVFTCNFVLEYALLDYDVLKWRPSQLAAAALACGFHLLGVPVDAVQFRAITGFNLTHKHMRNCITDLLAVPFKAHSVAVASESAPNAQEVCAIFNAYMRKVYFSALIMRLVTLAAGLWGMHGCKEFQESLRGRVGPNSAEQDNSFDVVAMAGREMLSQKLRAKLADLQCCIGHLYNHKRTADEENGIRVIHLAAWAWDFAARGVAISGRVTYPALFRAELVLLAPFVSQLLLLTCKRWNVCVLSSNANEARRWYELSASLGSAEAASALDDMYEQERLVLSERVREHCHRLDIAAPENARMARAGEAGEEVPGDASSANSRFRTLQTQLDEQHSFSQQQERRRVGCATPRREQASVDGIDSGPPGPTGSASCKRPRPLSNSEESDVGLPPAVVPGTGTATGAATPSLLRASPPDPPLRRSQRRLHGSGCTPATATPGGERDHGSRGKGSRNCRRRTASLSPPSGGVQSNWGTLPEDIVIATMRFLLDDQIESHTDLVKIGLACQHWRLVSLHDSLWRGLDVGRSMLVGLTDRRLQALSRCYGRALRRANFAGCLIIGREHQGSPQIFSLSSRGLAFFAHHCHQVVSLSLAGCGGLTDDAIAPLAARCTALTDVDLSGCCKLTNAGIGALCGQAAIGDNNTHTRKKTSLRRLVLMGCEKLSDPSIAHIGDGCPELQHLSLAGCGHLISVRLLARCSKLVSLNVVGCRNVTARSFSAMIQGENVGKLPAEFGNGAMAVNGEGSAAVAADDRDAGGEVTSSRPNKLPGVRLLEHLDLKDCHEVTDGVLAAVGEHCTRLRVLELRRCFQVTDAGAAGCVLTLPSLESIDLSNCDHVGHQTVAALAGCTNLRSLDLSNCDVVTADVMTSMAQRCAKLRSVGLCECDMGRDSVQALAENCPELERVDLTSCTHSVNNQVVKTFVQRCPNLRYLSLAMCQGITEVAVRALKQHGKNLRCVVLNGCGLADGVLDARFAQALHALKDKRPLCIVRDDEVPAVS